MSTVKKIPKIDKKVIGFAVVGMLEIWKRKRMICPLQNSP